MLGALGNGCLQRLVGRFGRGEGLLQFVSRAAAGCHERGGEDQDQRNAGEVDREQDASAGVRFGASGRKQPARFRHRLFEVAGDGCGRRAIFPADQRHDAGVVTGVAQPDQFAVEGDPALHQHSGVFDQPLLAGTGADGLDQAVQGRQDRVAGMVIFGREFLIAG